MPVPVRQGDVDALCGIYALMNLQRLQRDVETDPRDVEEDGLSVEAEFFVRALHAVASDTEGDLVKTVTEGLDAMDLIWLSTQLGGPKFKEVSPATIESVANLLSKNKGVIVYFEGDDFTHYSVALSADEKTGSLTLFDSWEFEQFSGGTLVRQGGGPSVISVRMTKVLAT